MARRPATSDAKRLGESRKAWNDFLGLIDSTCRELEKEKTHFFEPWFRGHPSIGYELTPQLFRPYPNPNAKKQKKLIREQEQDYYWEFASRARELHGVVEEDWDILFAMQHYGVPTRLLDWTENLAVAVYFALHDFSAQPGVPLDPKKRHRPCVWVLNPYELNALMPEVRDLYDPKNLGWDESRREYWGYSEMIIEEEGEDGIDWELPIALYPRQRTNRMQAQRGWFTIHGTDFRPLEANDRYLRQIELPKECFLAAREALRHAGISLFTMFPELPSLALHLKRDPNPEREVLLARLRPKQKRKARAR
jgi:hypothetical protein